ncbi:DUF1178 family protein [Pseudooceanicola aestuarii]|uniref:DUF1178 family protein n=1 Tax=Pseudooceanicola aestuarii TaxID=2697319 RepID=UPI0013D38BAE|nr:DUF1178 family protein [Pseudooceanicola aestuarii]
MIQFSLKCSNDHRFDSWFQSSDAFEKLLKAGMIGCSVCGDTKVEKALMAPRVRPGRAAEADATTPTAAPQPPATPTRPLSAPGTPAQQALAALRKQILSQSTYVGGDFAREARSMHLGDTPERPIHGEARPEEARALLEDGVPVLPLPFAPGRKTN